MMLKPRFCEINGHDIEAGDFLHIISDATKHVRLTTWSSKQGKGRIQIGHYCLISPGVEITAADAITIGNNTMIASECSIQDCDWHGIYNRTRPFRCTKPITIGENVWLGARVTVCKGVHIGENSVVGAGSVVTTDIPANTVAAGNPAKIVKNINPNRRMLKREFLFQKGDFYSDNQSKLDQYLCSDNTLWRWLRSLMAPTTKD